MSRPEKSPQETQFTEQFGKELKLARKRKGLKQTSLAKMIGLKSNQITRYERNICSPTLYYGLMLMKILDIPLDEQYRPRKKNPRFGLKK